MKPASLTFLLPAVIFAAMMTVVAGNGIITYLSFRDTIRSAAQDALTTAMTDRADRISAQFQEFATDLSKRSQTSAPQRALQELAAALPAPAAERDALTAAYTTANPNPPGTREVLADAGDGSAYSAAHAAALEYFTAAQAEHGYYDAFLISPTGRVLLTVEKEGDFMADLATGPLAQSGLGQAFAAAMRLPAGEVTFVDYAPYAPSNGDLAAFIATQVVDANGKSLGVMALQVPEVEVNMPRQFSGALAGARFQVIAPDGRVRYTSAGAGATASLGATVALTDPVRAALAGQSGVLQGQSLPDGETATLAYAPIDVLGQIWAITITADETALYSAMTAKVQMILAEIATVILLVVAFGWVVTRWIGQPLMSLGAAVAHVTNQQLDTPIPALHRKDEVGQIAREIDTLRLRQIAARETDVQNAYMGAGFRLATVAMMIADASGTIRFVNGAAVALFRQHSDAIRTRWPTFDPDALEGSPISQFHRAETTQRIQRKAFDHSGSGAEIDIGPVKLALTITPVTDTGGELVGYLVIWQDVVEQRKSAAVVDAIRRNQVMIELDAEGKILNINPLALQTYGYTQAEMVGMPFARLLQDGGATLPDVMNRLRVDGYISQRQARITKSGAQLWVDSTLNAIRDSQGRVYRIIAICSDVTAQVERQTQLDHAQQSQRAAQEQVVTALGQGLRDLSLGNLTRAIDTPFPDEYDALRRDFNAALEQLNTALAQVVDGAANIRGGSSEITDAADDLSRRTESQAATLEETAAALDELTLSVRSAAEGAADADRTVKSARAQAEASGTVVIEAVAAMSAIEQSSRQISQIIGVIDDIAFQTNLLALNAGVEAARAGEAGRGFAVVASEVRALAQRSSEAAKEIKQLISASSRQVEAGVGLVGQTGEALKTIVAGVSEISALVSNIAQSSREQATGLAEINSGVSMLDQVTQQNAAMVEQSTAASHSLRKEAEGLADLVSRFQLRGAQPPAQVTPLRRAANSPTLRAWSRDLPAAAGWEEF